MHHADNIECLHDWCKKRFEGMGEQLNGFFKEVSCLLLYETFCSSINAKITLIMHFLCGVMLCACCRMDTTKIWRLLTDPEDQSFIRVLQIAMEQYR